ncbi:carbohydrate ABC transporter permease [Ktedonosporobacter rubrisoli]|uniref:Carbohydrate ABC transporter permease n=1 Tax=Ktedonosporobacter rubrisoli TaxID=2509675 RepID=A0A4P6JLS0_KTERU|nr:carbohydrate ABC transporter permease [Ktedonosporobacter rubrisoli]QBD75606.1 carbohydrate ABC transporter permease [Ktedonosporobacter rubrisoli]
MSSLEAGLRLEQGQRPAPSNRLLRHLLANAIWYIILVLGAIVSLFPYYLALLTSLKPVSQIFAGAPWSLPGTFTLDNYISVLTQYSFPSYIVQTLIFAVVATVGQLIFSTFASYAFARMKFPGRDTIFWLYLATMMVPNIVTLIPLFILMRTFHWIDTYFGLLLPYVLGTPYGIFLMRQFFKTIPTDLENSARIEGANTLQIIAQIIIPLSRPILGTLAVITFVQQWNNFLWPLIITNSQSMRVLTVGIASFQSSEGAQWHLMMAATFVALGPLLLLFFIFQKRIVQSIHLGSGIK